MSKSIATVVIRLSPAQAARLQQDDDKVYDPIAERWEFDAMDFNPNTRELILDVTGNAATRALASREAYEALARDIHNSVMALLLS